MFPSSKTQDRISALEFWLRKIATQTDVHPENENRLGKLSIHSEKFSRLLVMIEDYVGIEFNPLRLEERIIIRENGEERNCMALMGYFGVVGVDLIKTIGNYGDDGILTLEDRNKISDRWIEFEEQKIWLNKLNGYLMIGGPIAVFLFLLGKIGKRV